MKANCGIRLYSGANPAQNFYNFGDALGSALIAKLSGREVELSPFWKADIAGPGSILFAGDALFLADEWHSLPGIFRIIRDLTRRIAYPSIKVWGSGFIRPPNRYVGVFSKSLEVCAVRGRLTLDILKKMRIVKDSQPVVLGDPGLLYPILLDEMPQKKYDIGIVPQYVDKVAGKNMHEKLLSVGVSSRLIDVNLKDSIMVLRQIASCKTILSSSLHGCIVADAMSIPNRLIQLSMLSEKPSPTYLDYAFKFLDYYSIYGLTSISPMQINDFYCDPKGLPVRIMDEYSIDPNKVKMIKRDLTNSFPIDKDR